ncbi:FAD-linked oxidoreductase [Beutenbergia cavernae DSM 12333]|uniref:FAD-linked oxidoreductase n=1 Tax=Beutenbergia cavernae (strain ATCC BAA-8 / DSM 12333 / CCUG 43141 / JCM 11478 / NBRC 16432 / NCIMB 13614 / HKI 0122) TaxID=471853 RepID=C5C5G4_BEUC1|nr:D-arabinono-1,4-lactone oxidase [Beutenbergia cavernae]ACQ80155.1 FAD-linked oxidoreductase [Beutenbergia cavernae DSM 12333]
MRRRWSNWGRSAQAEFAAVARPRDEDALAATIRSAARAGQRVRALGAGHSFTPAAVTDGVSVRLDHVTGLWAVDEDAGLVTVGAGTRLRDLPGLLRPYGLAMENLGDIDVQTIAGAISTGTHGTGSAFTGIAGQVRGLRIALADGTLVDCSPQLRRDLFEAARLGLGAFGVLVSVTLQCVPAFQLAAHEHAVPLDGVLEGYAELVRSEDHLDLYWFPHTRTALVKANRREASPGAAQPLGAWRAWWEDEFVSNGLLALVSEIGAAAPSAVPVLNRIAAATVAERRYTGDSHAVFTAPRRVRFREMEYAIPLAALPDAVREIRRTIDARGWRISWPLEIRTAAADDVWLSTAYERDSAYVAVHRYVRDPFVAYFREVEEVLLAFGGRPHWGKLHTQSVGELSARYPRLDDARRVRREVDPAGTFANRYVDRVLGSVTSA